MVAISLVFSREFYALVFNFFASVFIIVINKMVFSVVRFSWPAALTLFHYLVTMALLRVLRCCGVFELGTGGMTRRLWTLSFLMGLSPIINNMSLDMNSVGVYQTSKLLLIPVVVLFEFFSMGKRVSARRALLLLVITAGTA